LSDAELTAVIETLPEGLAIIAEGHTVWANRLARKLSTPRVTTRPADDEGTELGELVERFVGRMPALRSEDYARWAVTDGDVVEVALRRLWSSQVAVRLSVPPELARAPGTDDAFAPLTSCELLIVERLLDESVLGIVVADAAGHIEWINTQAHRMLGPVARRVGLDARRDLARAARHVASGILSAPVRTRVALPTRTVGARFWNVAPGLAGVLLYQDVDEVALRCVGSA
jgi:hypothetical protein